jgi:hypothetical protein
MPVRTTPEIVIVVKRRGVTIKITVQMNSGEAARFPDIRRFFELMNSLALGLLTLRFVPL